MRGEARGLETIPTGAQRRLPQHTGLSARVRGVQLRACTTDRESVLLGNVRPGSPVAVGSTRRAQRRRFYPIPSRRANLCAQRVRLSDGPVLLWGSDVQSRQPSDVPPCRSFAAVGGRSQSASLVRDTTSWY